MKKIYIILIILLVSSCASFLEPNSPSEFIPKKISSLNEMLTSGGYYSTGGEHALFTYIDIFSDDVQVTTENSTMSNYSNEEKCHKFIAMTDNVFEGSVNNPWISFYESIKYCNAVMDYIHTVEGTESEKNYVKAQALFLRALSYFYLVNYYGKPYNFDKKAPAVPLKLNSGLVLVAPRNSVEEVYDQIVEDLLEAERCWEATEEAPFRKDYRASLPATQFLLAKTYLFMENWSEAKRYAEKVLMWSEFSLYDLNGFSLAENSPNLSYSNYNTGETIFMYGSVKDLTALHGYNGYLPKVDPDDKNESAKVRRTFIASTQLRDTYGTDESDLRKKYYMLKQYENNEFLDTYRPCSKVANSVEMAPITDDPKFPAMKFRISEVYLILAEAYAMMGGNDDKALKLIDDLREVRIATGKFTRTEGLTGAALLEFIKTERRRELCFEGSRWFDMRRWGMESYVREWRSGGEVKNIYVIEKNDNAFTFPITQKVLDNNNALVQNPLSKRTI